MAAATETVVDDLHNGGLAGVADTRDHVECSRREIELMESLAVTVVQDDRQDLHQTDSPQADRTVPGSPARASHRPVKCARWRQRMRSVV